MVAEESTTMAKATIEEAIGSIARGEIVVVVDDEARENEGDLVMAGQCASAEKIAFFLEHASGLVCVSLMGDRLDELDVPLMVAENTESQHTAFTVTVDAARNTTTGISADDRAVTIAALVDPSSKPSDLRRPGHVLPLRYKEGGVLKRAGHTEAAVDLARLAGLAPIGVLCEILSKDKRHMARRDELDEFANENGLCLITISDLIQYRRRNEKLVELVSSARIPSKLGEFTGYVFRSLLDDEEHFALVAGDVAGDEPVLTRVHSECLTGDVFGSGRCDCGPQLEFAMQKVAEEGRGVIIYLRGHEGRGIGLGHKLRAYTLQEQGFDTVDANIELGLPVDSREYGIGAQILVELGVKRLRLMTNNPAKYGGLDGFGLDIVERIPIELAPTPDNIAYLRTKRERLGHLLVRLDDGS
jgi:3,4-dihydroxy 2-butanone 4-phosphate synthase/GTP cyclohydrolase II